MKRVYISDLDGTLLNPKAELSQKTIQILNRLIAAGLQFSFATARTAATVVQMTREVSVPLPVILMNGALVYDLRQKQYLNTVYLPRQTVTEIVTILKRYGLSGFCYTIEKHRMNTYYDVLKTQAMREFYEERRRKYQKQFTKVASFEQVDLNKVVYFSFLNTEEVLTPVYEALRKVQGISIEYYRDIYKTNQWYLELLSAKASKRQGAEFLREYTGADELIGFGDNFNDLPLFEACEKSYAVENAPVEVKAAANGVIGSNAQDGVACYLEQHWQA